MKEEHLRKCLFAGRGKASVDLVIKNARVVNVCSGEIEDTDVAISEEWVVGVGAYPDAKQVFDAQGAYLVPGLIDAHTHIESSMLAPAEYARVVVPHGTSAVVSDPHEIANVIGIAGIEYFLASTQHLPLSVYFTAPSCVPVASFEQSGAEFTGKEIREILHKERVVGLGEMMNYPELLEGDPNVLDILQAARHGRIDGHAPELRGKDLNAYLMAGVHADHESTTLEEAREKLRKGMYVMIREGSSEQNLEALLPLVTEKTIHRCMLVSDDKDCSDLSENGHLDHTIRKAIRLGLDPMMAIRMATLNPADYYRLARHGAIAPGYYANFLLVENLKQFEVRDVYYHGKRIAQSGKPLFTPPLHDDPAVFNSIHLNHLSEEDFCLRSPLEHFPVIELIPGNILTKKREMPVTALDGCIQADTERDLLLLACVERHTGSGDVGLGLVKGFGLTHGALAASVAHDSHHILVVGADSHDMYTAVKHLQHIQGGLVVVGGNGQIMADLPLPIAGLLSTLPAEEVLEKHHALAAAARDLGASPAYPFMHLSFLALTVIPELRVTTQGIFDVETLKVIY